LSRIALAFSFPAYFALGILGLSVIASLSDGSLIKGLMAGILGLMIATIGTDPLSGVSRFTFGEAELLGGIPFILVMVGLFAVSELMAQTYAPAWKAAKNADTKIKLPSFKTWRGLWKAQGIGSGIGIFEGCMPGAGGSIAAFMSYNEAKRWSKKPEEFGKGSLEAVAAPEASNNTVAGTAIVPVLSFGIPGSNSTAILLGGLLIHGLTPGPLLFQKSPEFVYGLFSGLAVANFALFFIGILILTPAIWLVNRPKPYLMAGILALVFSGIYSIDSSVFDLIIVLIAGVIGYFMRLLGFSFLPMVLGLVLGYMIEANYRRALAVSSGDHMIFVQDPISLGLLLAAAAFVTFSIVRDVRARRKAAGANQ
jgi:putative tricarboxylic transport membrane protein